MEGGSLYLQSGELLAGLDLDALSTPLSPAPGLCPAACKVGVISTFATTDRMTQARGQDLFLQPTAASSQPLHPCLSASKRGAGPLGLDSESGPMAEHPPALLLVTTARPRAPAACKHDLNPIDKM